MRLIHQSRKEERLVDIVSSDTHIRRELNGNDTMEFFTQSKIDKEDYILRHVSEVLYEEYIVKSVTETREGFEVYAENSITELKTEVVPPQKMHLVNPSYPLVAILKNTRWAIGTVDPGYMMDFMSEEAYAYDLLKQIIATWPLEVETEINIDSTGKINRLIHLKNKIHREKGHRFEPGKGLSKVSRIIHDDEIYTAIKPLGDKYRSFHGRASAGSSRDIEVNKELSINASGIGGFGDYLYRVEGINGSGTSFLIQDYGGNEGIKWTPTQVGNYKIIIKIKDIALDEVATLSADFYVKNKENIPTSNKVPPIFTGDIIDDGQEHYLTIGPINSGDDWIYNEDARAEWGRKIPGQDARHRYGLIEIKVRDRSVLLDLAETALVESSSPKVEYEADINDIKNDTRTKEPIKLGDTCAVIDDELGIEIQSRIVAIDEEVESRKITATIANVYTNKNSLTGIISNAVSSQIQSFSLGNNQRISELEKINSVSDKFGDVLPSDPYVGQLYYLYGQDGTIQVMEYNGLEWIERLSDLTGEITKAKVETAQSSAQTAIEEAEKANNEAIKAITGLSTKADQSDLEKTETDILSLQSTKADLTDLQKTDNDILAIQGRLDPTIPDSLAYQVASHTSTIAEQGGRLETLRGDFDSLEVHERNLLLDSKPNVTNSKYLLYEFPLSEEGKQLEEGEEITVILKGKLGEGKESFWIYNSRGMGIFQITRLHEQHKIGEDLYRGTSKWKWRENQHQVQVYAALNSVESSSTIEWIKLVRGDFTSIDWTPAPEDLASSTELNEYKQTSEGYFQRVQSIETDLASGLTYTKIQNIKNTADRAESTLAQLTDGDVTAYNQKISTALGDIQAIKNADYSTQISNIAGRINVQIVSNADGSKSMMDMTSNQLLYNIDGGKIQITKDKFYMDQTLIVPIIQATKLSASQIESGTFDANKANIINLNVANLVGENADLIRGSFNAINTSINIDGTSLTTKGNWGGDIKLSNRGLTIYDNLAGEEMGVLYGLFRNEDDPLRGDSMLATGLFANYGYKLNLGFRNTTDNENYSVISIDRTEENGFPQMNVFGDIVARYDLKMMGGMLTGATNAGYTVTEANGGHCIEFANGWKIQFWRSTYQTFTSGWTGWTFPKRFTSIPRVVLAQAMRDDENLTLCNAYALNYQACNIRIQDKTLQWTIVAIAIGR